MVFSSDKAREFLNEAAIDQFISERDEISRKFQDLAQYDALRVSIENVCVKAYGKAPAGVYFFGSRVIGLATEESDLDIFVDQKGSFRSSFVKSEEILKEYVKLGAELSKNDDWEVQVVALDPPIPVICATFLPMKLKCDLAMTNGLSTKHSQLFAHLFKIQPEAAHLYHFLKAWLKIHGCTFVQGYTLVLLVVFFLQSLNLMPTIRKVQEKLPAEFIAGWEVQFDSNRTLTDYSTDKMQNFKKYLTKFFEFFSNYDFSNVISTFEGKSIASSEYKETYENYKLEGIFIVGPFNKGKNSGNMDNQMKNELIELFKSSRDWFESSDLTLK